MNFGFPKRVFTGVLRRFDVKPSNRLKKLPAIYQQIAVKTFVGTIS
jgi:hypothetical protein